MSEAKKPREFKLEVDRFHTNAVGWGDVINPLTTGEVIHVIEVLPSPDEKDQRIAELEAKLLEAEKDSKRLDWKIENPHVRFSDQSLNGEGDCWTYSSLGSHRGYFTTPRLAIDDAMKENEK